ncbi:MAG: TonB-dependent receptor [Pseudomonadota bacterium]
MKARRNQLGPLAKILGTVSLAALSTAAFAQASNTPAQTPTPPQGAVPATDPVPPAGQPATEDVAAENEVVVTGFRASLASALNAKRKDNGIVDVVKAEDIAKFPDTNLAESLQRVPGVAIDRDAGEGRTISVRGLGADFTRVRINSIEALATTGGTDSSGGANRSRGFDFNVFASELFNSLTVRKSSSAEVQEGSLGATVDLQTARPFDFKKTTISVSAQGRYNDLREKIDPRIAGLFSTTFLDGKVGVLASAAYSKRRLYEEGFSTVRYDNGPSSGGFCSPIGVAPLNPTTTATTCGAATGFGPGPARLPNTATNIAEYTEAASAANFHPRLPRYGRLTHDQNRFGATGSLQVLPFDGTKVTLDLVYSKLKATRQEDFLEAISFSRSAAQGGKPQTSVVDTSYDADGDLLYGLYNGVDIRSEQRFDRLSTEFFQRSLDIEQDITDDVRARVRYGRATSHFRNPVQTTTTLDALNVNGYAIDFRNDDRTPAITYPFDVTTAGAPGGLTLVAVPTGATTVANTTTSEIRIRPQGANNDNLSFQTDLVWDILPSEISVKGGFDYRKYDFDTFEFRRVNQADTIFAPPAGTTLASLTTLLTGFGKGLNIPAGTPTSWVVPNLNAIAAAYDIYCNCLKSGPVGGPGDFTLSSITNGNARGNNRAVVEKDTGGYVQVDASGDLFGFAARGNIGVRYVETRQSATGYQALGGGTEVTVSQTYDDWLPSVNFAVDITPDFVARLAAAKVMARPQLGNLSPGGAVNTTGNLTITVGNPLLQPFRANTVDASFEWYFHKGALLGLGLFYKNIGTYIQSLRLDNVPYSTTGLPTSLLPINLQPPIDPLFQVTTPVNTSGGVLKGFEINYQQPFYFLPGMLKNFGIIANLTKVKSKISYATSPTNPVIIRDDLVGLSPTSANGTLYYDDGRFSIRGSLSYREAFLQRVPGQNNNDVEGKNSTLNVDASASYKITPRIELTLEGVNLTDEFNDQFISRARNSPVVYNHTGREVYAGVRLKF